MATHDDERPSARTGYLAVRRLILELAMVSAASTGDTCILCRRRGGEDLVLCCERCGAEVHGQCYAERWPAEYAAWLDEQPPLMLCLHCRS
jgi:hypothetical protein